MDQHGKFRALVRFVALAALLAGLAAPVQAQECRQALALGLDVSGSVDSREYRLQLDGLANALMHPEIREALLVMPAAPVRLAVYEWSGPAHQTLIVDWTAITGAEALGRIGATLRSHARRAADPSTGLGMALRSGTQLLAAQPTCWKRTLDISGDGKSNAGPRPQDIALPDWLTVNALVIGNEAPSSTDRLQPEIGELVSYFRAYVISGADGFAETALGFDDYERAMVRKLKRELQGPALSGLAPADAPHR